MANGVESSQVSRSSADCSLGWCPGTTCTPDSLGERFHSITLASESTNGGTETVGVDLVQNDFADGTSTGPLVEITWSALSDTGVSQHSVQLTPERAAAFGAAVRSAGVRSMHHQPT